jgi:hypothetical protein
VRRQIDDEFLEMALLGYRTRREEVIRKMSEIEALLRLRRTSGTAPSADSGTTISVAKPKRKLSAAGRRAILAGVKKRWAAFHAKARASKTVKTAAKAKRVMVPAPKATPSANLAVAKAAKTKKAAEKQPA